MVETNQGRRMFISPAYAQAGDAGGGGAITQLLVPIALMFAIFYFLLIRPQQKKAKEHRAKLDAIKRGDRVITGGGIIGIVTKAVTDEVTVEISEGVRVSVTRATIGDVIPKVKRSDAKQKIEAKEEKPKGLLQGLLGGRK